MHGSSWRMSISLRFWYKTDPNFDSRDFALPSLNGSEQAMPKPRDFSGCAA
jgi:hypothetical protein